MDPRSDQKPNPIDLWKQTDKKSPASFFLAPRQKAENPLAKAACVAYTNAKAAAYVTLPVVAMSGITIMREGKNQVLDLRPVGFPIFVGGVLIDTVKAPITATVAVEEGIRAGVTKLLSLIFEKDPTVSQIDRIFQSFLIRMRQAEMVLEKLGLEEPGVMEKKLKSGDIEDLVGYTLLLTAYVSRNAYSGLMLANGTLLLRDDCPKEHLRLFDKINELKEAVKNALSLATINRYSDKEQQELEESAIVCDWIRLIKAGKQIQANDKPEATTEQIAAANKVIALIDDLKKFAMKTLPESPSKVANHVSIKP